MSPPRLPHGGQHCITVASLRQLAEAMERLDFWYRGIKPGHVDPPCLREVEMSPKGRLVAMVSFIDEPQGFVMLEYINGRWEEQT